MQKVAHKFEGKIFERLKIVKRLENHITKGGVIFSKWLCRCICGNEVSVLGIDLKSKKTRSCGCLHDESSKQNGLANKIHGGYSENSSVDDIIKFMTIRQIKYRARIRGYESDLEIADLPILTDICPVLGIKYKKGKGRLQDASPSIDRFDSNLPYLKKYKSHLTFMSHKANRIKNNGTLDDLKNVLKFIETKKESLRRERESSLIDSKAEMANEAQTER
jgi:hypothetical protein